MVRNLLIALLCIGVFAPQVAAQTQARDISQPVIASNPFQDFASDHWGVLKSPLRIQRRDLRWLVPLGAGTAALLATDSRVSAMARDAEGVRPTSRFLSHGGNVGALALVSGGFYSVGKLTGNSRAADTGKLTAEGLLHTQLVIHGLKLAFNRERPEKDGGRGEFWSGGKSFPSGHAASAFAFATITANQYKGNKLVVIGAYGFATAVSLSRVGGLKHHPSDILIGAAIGHLIGRYVTHRHQTRD
jgi:hypothetical protein